MSSLATGRPGVATTRRRPAAHFTPRRGWVNDPYGVHWDGTRYHLYYQALPDRTTWAPECSWGHAVSADLAHWTELPAVLVPHEFESGCWSGAVVSDGPGGPIAFYTRMRDDDAGLSEIALARPVGTSGTFESGPEDIAVDGPPPGLGITAFRDPFVRAGDRGWSMLVGAGRADGSGAVLEYESADLLSWRYRGVLAAGFADSGRPGHREVWECPQLVEVDGRSVLIVSVMEDDLAHHVAAAVGTFDGSTFTHDGWAPLAHGGRVYATSVFTDRDGRPAAISWLQEAADHDAAASAWAGAHTAPALLTLAPGGRVTLAVHPELRATLPVVRSAVVDLDGAPEPSLLTLSIDGVEAVEVRAHGSAVLSVTLRRDDGRLGVVDRHGRTWLLDGDPSATVVMLDADVVEVFTGRSYGAWRAS